MEQFMTLAEAASNLETDIESLVRSAVCDDLTVFALAKDWAVQGDDDIPPNNLNGQVYLLAEDLLQGLGAESIPVCQVRMPENDEIVTLLETQQVRRGILYITVEEFDRFRRQHALTLKVSTGSPPYLNRHHEWYSPKLAAAVNAWLVLFADGNFRKGNKGVIDQIESWLMANTDGLSPRARGCIATVVNPKKTKGGGAPTTSGK
jgi:hypothetical protein